LYLVGLVWWSGVTAPEWSAGWWVMLLGKWLAYGLPVSRVRALEAG
jgi:hypothetical protein